MRQGCKKDLKKEREKERALGEILCGCELTPGWMNELPTSERELQDEEKNKGVEKMRRVKRVGKSEKNDGSVEMRDSGKRDEMRNQLGGER